MKKSAYIDFKTGKPKDATPFLMKGVKFDKSGREYRPVKVMSGKQYLAAKRREEKTNENCCQNRR